MRTPRLLKESNMQFIPVYKKIQTKEGYAYDFIGDDFYDLLEELFEEVKRDAYYGRATALEEISKKIESIITVNDL